MIKSLSNYKKQAVLSLFLNSFVIVFGNIFYYYDFSTFMKNLIGFSIIFALLFNYHFILQDNSSLDDSPNLKNIVNHFKIIYLIYSFIAIIGLLFFTLNQKMGNFQLFLMTFYIGALYAILSFISLKKDISIIQIPNKLPLVRFIIRFIIAIITIVLIVGVVNMAFRYGSTLSIAVGLAASSVSFHLFLGTFPLWLLSRRLYDKNKHKFRYWFANIIGIILIFLFIIPFVCMPFIVGYTNPKFDDAFGSDWRKIPFDTSQGWQDISKDTPFLLTAPFFGEDYNLLEGRDYKVEQNRIYVNNSDYQLYYNIHYPTSLSYNRGFGKNNTLIFIHGGGWVSGTRNNSLHLQRHLSSQGFVVFSIDYRLTDINLLDGEAEIGFELPNVENPSQSYRIGPYQIPDMMKDIGDFTFHLSSLSESERFNANLDKVTLLGQSAGAYLASLVGYGYDHPRFMGNFSQELTISNLILYYPPIFTEHFFYGHQFFNSRFQMINGTPETNPEDYYYLTPINLMNSQSPPTILLHGTIDDLVSIENSDAVLEKAESLGVLCIQIRLYMIGHGFTNNPQYHIMELYYLERWLNQM